MKLSLKETLRRERWELKVQRRTLLQKRRLLLGLSQQELADIADISRTYYTNIEIGRKNPSLLVAKRIAEALQTKMDIFFTCDVTKGHKETKKTPKLKPKVRQTVHHNLN